MRKTTPPSFFSLSPPPPVHSIELLVPCVVNAMPLASCCVVRMCTRDSIALFLLYGSCLSISHQYAHWELGKKKIRLNRQTSVCVDIGPMVNI